MSKEVCLAILESTEDAVLIRKYDDKNKHFCKKCATKKLNVIRFCEISIQDANELINLYKDNVVKLRKLNVKCECI